MTDERLTIRCPRCELNFYTPYSRQDIKEGDWVLAEHDPQYPAPPPPALSRTTREEEDVNVYVCSECGSEEAMQDAFEGGATPQSEWPLAVVRHASFGVGADTQFPANTEE